MKKLLKWGAAITAMAGVITSAVIYTVFSDVKEAADEMYVPIDEQLITSRKSEVIVTTKEPFSALILGVDEREGDRGRSDTLIVLTVNPTLQTTKLLSIPRDSYVEIYNKNIEDKINHAYAFGGIELSVQTVEQLLQIPIDYVTKINMEGFVDLIDIIGNIPVHNAFEFYYEGEYYPEGELLLNGERALKYVRMRYDDPQGDFGRQNRQKEIIKGVLQKGISFRSTLRYADILSTLKENVEMNLTIDTISSVQKNYASSFKTIEQLHFVEGVGKKMDGIYYYLLNEQELTQIQTDLQRHLQLQHTSSPDD
jgi:polyisoprenyl-teichoic acid--peptidoglycan teichoic acid transferase